MKKKKTKNSFSIFVTYRVVNTRFSTQLEITKIFILLYSSMMCRVHRYLTDIDIDVEINISS